jgi:hypothetical protein
MSFLTSLLSVVFETIESGKGQRVLVPIDVINDPKHCYNLDLSDGSHISIHCDEKRYLYKSPKWYIPNRYISIYKVYPQIGYSVSKEVSDKFIDKELYIDNLYHRYTNIEQRKKAAISAFVDIVLLDTKK